MKKISEETNVLTWFEIPVIDLDRSKTFYEMILDIQMVKRKDGDNDAAFFPFNPEVAQAKSSRVTGVLSKSEQNNPSSDGTLIYINANPNIQKVLDKVEPAGGKIIVPRRKIDTGSNNIDAGFVAVIIDTEGNKIGLHAEK